MSEYDPNPELNNITSYGAIAGVDQKTAIEACIAAQVKNQTFTSFYSAMPNPSVCRVVIPASVSPIVLTDYVDTLGTVVEYNVDDAVVLQDDCGKFLNGNIYRSTRASVYSPHGQLDNSTTKSYSIGSGFLGFPNLKRADVPALVNGWITQEDSQVYQDDGMVALQVNAGSPENWFFRSEAVTYTATTATLVTAVDNRLLRKNMMIQTLHSTPFRGVLQSWSADGKTLTVNSWLALGDTTKTPITPANGTGLLINAKPKIWGINTTGTLTSDGYAYQMAVGEISSTNNKVQPASISDPNGRSWTWDCVTLNSSYKVSAHYMARGLSLFGYYASGLDTGFEAGPVADLGYARPTVAFSSRAQTSALNVYNPSGSLTAQILSDGSASLQKLTLFTLTDAIKFLSGSTDAGKIQSSGTAVQILAPGGGTTLNVQSGSITTDQYFSANRGYITKEISQTLPNGRSDNIALNAGGQIAITGPTAAFSISGIAGGIAGREITLVNTTSQTLTILHFDANSASQNQIIIRGGASLSIAGAGAVRLVYSAAISKWLVL